MNHRDTFSQLHQQANILLLPNAWDTVSAMILEQAGFSAIGTTSWGMANAHGYCDGEQIAFIDVLQSVKAIINAVNIPVSVDIESGYATTIDGMTENILRLADIGVAGINIEDSPKHIEGLRSITEHSQYLTTIRNALDQHGYNTFFINARTDTYLQPTPAKQDTIERAKAYIDSGANGIFVPGISEADDIQNLTESINAPVNVMSLPSLTDIDAIESLGVKRFSLGNSLSDAMIRFVEQKAKQLLTTRHSQHLYDSAAPTTTFISHP